MDKVEFVRVDRSRTGSNHIKTLINNKDVGILYLNDVESDILHNLIISGIKDANEVELIWNVDNN